MNEVRKLFSDILKQERKMKKMDNSADNTEFYKEREILVDMLRKFLYVEFTTLSKAKFLKLCCLVSSYRPVQPFSFLVSISMQCKDE